MGTSHYGLHHIEVLFKAQDIPYTIKIRLDEKYINKTLIGAPLLLKGDVFIKWLENGSNQGVRKKL